MDYNDIQNMWKNDQAEGVALPKNLDKIKSANTPLDKIRKNLKNELIAQVIALIIIGFIPFMHDFPAESILPYYLLYSMFTGVSAYYLVRLFLFYKRLNNITLNTKDSLYETYFDIRLNMELYKTFGFALTPFIILFLGGYLYFLEPGFNFASTGTFSIIGVGIGLAITILAVGLMLEWWVYYYYGKYAKDIRKILGELKEN